MNIISTNGQGPSLLVDANTSTQPALQIQRSSAGAVGIAIREVSGWGATIGVFTGAAYSSGNDATQSSTTSPIFEVRSLLTTGGTAKSGYGGSIMFTGATDTGLTDADTIPRQGSLEMMWLNPTNYESQFKLRLSDSLNSLTTRMEVEGATGAVTFNAYGVGGITGTFSRFLGVNSTGKVIELGTSYGYLYSILPQSTTNVVGVNNGTPTTLLWIAAPSGDTTIGYGITGSQTIPLYKDGIMITDPGTYLFNVTVSGYILSGGGTTVQFTLAFGATSAGNLESNWNFQTNGAGSSSTGTFGWNGYVTASVSPIVTVSANTPVYLYGISNGSSARVLGRTISIQRIA
jgi:hypothetical protein